LLNLLGQDAGRTLLLLADVSELPTAFGHQFTQAPVCPAKFSFSSAANAPGDQATLWRYREN
jgi:hypothetical protein